MGMRCVAAALALAVQAASGAAQPDAAAEAYQLAAGLHDRDLHQRAVQAFEDFLTRWPRHELAPKACFFLGQSLSELGRDEAALTRFEQALDGGSDLHPRALMRCGEVLHRLGRHTEALERLEPLVRSEPEPGLLEPALYFLGEAAAAADRPDRAREAFSRLLESFPEGSYAAYAHHALGFLESRAERHVRARACFETAAAQASGDPALHLEARAMVAECRLAEGDAETALRELDAILESGAGAVEAQVRLARARALLDLGHHDQALQAFRAFARDHPEHPRAPAALIRAAADMHRAGRTEAGLELLGLVPDDDGPHAADLAYWTGRLLDAAGEADAGIEKLRAGSRGSEERRFSLGDALARARRYEEAVAVFRGLRRKGRKVRIVAEATYAEAFARNRLGQYEQAAGLLRGMLRHEDLDARLREDALLALGENLFALRRYGEAAACLEPLAAQAGRHQAPALYKLSWCHYLLEDHEEALRVLAKLVAHKEAAPFAAEGHYLRGKCFEALGRPDASRDAFEAAAQAGEGEGLAARAHLGAAAAAVREGRPEEALRAYQRVLDAGPAPPERGSALLGRARVLAELGREEEALAGYQELLKDLPEHPLAPDAALGAAWCHRRLGQAEASVRSARRALSGEPSAEVAAEARYLAALGDHEEGRHRQALETLAPLLQRPEDAPPGRLRAAKLLQALCLVRLERDREALPVLETLAGAPPDTTDREVALYELAFCRRRLEDPAGYEQALAQLAGEHPQSHLAADAHFRLGEAHYEAGRHAEALERYVQAAGHPGLGGLEDKVFYKIGWCHRALEAHQEAARAFGRVAGLADSALAGESAFLAGEEWAAAGDHEQAARAFGRMLEEYPRHELAPEAAGRRVLALASLERWQEVVRKAPRALEGHPEASWTARVWSALGDAFRKRGRFSRARTAYARVVALSKGPLGARAQYQIARCHEEEGEPGEAVDAHLKVVILHGHAEWVRRASLAAGRILLEQGQKERGRRLLRELMEEHGDSEEARRARDLLAGSEEKE